jgi:hypothetical protein
MNKAVAKEFEIFCGKDIKPDDWLWCKRCHRCYKAFEFRTFKVKGEIFLFCHYDDCTGDLPLDSRRWNKLIKDIPGFPETPEKGEVYDLGSGPASLSLNN